MFKGLISTRLLGAAFLLAILLVYATARPGWAQTATRQVPQDYATVQAAIDAAQSGDVVLVAPGTYSGPVVIKGKRITLASEFHTTGDPARVNQTVLDGQGEDTIIEIDESAEGTQIIGFTIQNGIDGISLRAQASILNNRIRNTKDGIDSTSGGGLIKGNTFENNNDDGIDFDDSSSGVIEDNVIANNGDDGIEIRLHDHEGPPLTIEIRGNRITGNGEDGIQLIDYPGLTDRVFYIERNLIQGNADAGIGLMDNGDTQEDFRGASIPERIYVYNNTILDNPYALTGGDNLIALNNIFAGSSEIALKNVDGNSIVAYNLFWENGQDFSQSHVDAETTVSAAPLLDGDYALRPDSPAIDKGAKSYAHKGETVLNMPPQAYAGPAPDLGWREHGSSNSDAPEPGLRFPIILAAGDIATCSANAVAKQTAALLDALEGTVLTLGDHAYSKGTDEQFTNCYAPTWGRHKSRTKPVPGNHDYMTPGASGYYKYFGEAASPLDTNCTSDCKGYYSYDLGDWHIIALNSEIETGPDSAQVQWLRRDLAAHPTDCILAYWHRPRFSSGKHGNNESVQPLWQALYEYGADVVLSGHDHDYERFAPQNADGKVDAARGIRQFIAGTGGSGLRPFKTIQPNSQVRDNAARGVLKLTLHSTRYAWEFIPVEGQTFQDIGSSPCSPSPSHGAPSAMHMLLLPWMSHQ